MVECSGVAELVGHVPCPMRVLVGREGAPDSRLSQFGDDLQNRPIHDDVLEDAEHVGAPTGAAPARQHLSDDAGEVTLTTQRRLFGREQVAEEPVDVGVRVEHRGEGVPPFHGRVLDDPVGVEQDGRDRARLYSCRAFHARYWAKVSSSGG